MRMDADAIHPELRPLVRKIPGLDLNKRIFRFVGRVGPRMLPSARIPGVSVRWVRAGSLRLRLYQPDQPTSGAAMLWIHGGGLVIGSAKQDDRLCADTASKLGLPIVSVEYRLAPEFPFPAALDDAADAWQWIQHNAAALGADPARIVIGGESAGAGIAASLAQRLYDTSEVQPIAQWLFAPMLDDATAANTDLDALDHPIWNNRANRIGWSAYLGRATGAPKTPGAPADFTGPTAPPYAVPAQRRDLRGLPPAWMYVGDVELFHNEVVDYARRLRAAGVDVEFEVVDGAVHGFENWAGSTTLARDLIGRAQSWLRRVACQPLD
jgi:acetyl esterase/lipase